MLFCGVYDMKNRALYLTGNSLRILMEGKFPMVGGVGGGGGVYFTSREKEIVLS